MWLLTGTFDNRKSTILKQSLSRVKFVYHTTYERKLLYTPTYQVNYT